MLDPSCRSPKDALLNDFGVCFVGEADLPFPRAAVVDVRRCGVDFLAAPLRWLFELRVIALVELFFLATGRPLKAGAFPRILDVVFFATDRLVRAFAEVPFRFGAGRELDLEAVLRATLVVFALFFGAVFLALVALTVRLAEAPFRGFLTM